MSRWLLPIVVLLGILGCDDPRDAAEASCGGRAIDCAGRIRVECPDGFVPWYDGQGYAICVANPCEEGTVPVYEDHVTGRLPGEQPVHVILLNVACKDPIEAGQINLYH